LTAPAWPEPPAGGPLGDNRFALATVKPENVEALCEMVREQIAQGRAIYPQGGKTALDYGGVPGRPGVAIDTTAISRLIDYPYADMTITIEAGMTFAALQKTLAAQRQRVLLDAPCPGQATLGGIYATNTSGPRRFGAGRPRDQIIGVSFVTSEGVVVKGGGRVVKNVAGYDFPKLLTGSLGTLGVITQLTLKVRPLPESSAIAWVRFRSMEIAAATLDLLNTSATRPMALELFNRSGATLVGKERGLPTGEFVLAIGFEDGAKSVRWQLDQLKSELKHLDVTLVEDETAPALWAAMTEFQAKKLEPIGMVANLRASSVVSFVGGLDPERWAVQAHAGNGIVRAHSLGPRSLEHAAEQVARYRKMACDDGGNLILAACPTAWKERLHVWGEPRPDWAIGEKVKRALDPHGAMNPGRFVGGI
jgi:glycolate oxidase FAD binding subunit